MALHAKKEAKDTEATLIGESNNSVSAPTSLTH